MTPLKVILRDLSQSQSDDETPSLLPDREYLLYQNRVFEFYNVKDNRKKYGLYIYTRTSSDPIYFQELKSSELKPGLNSLPDINLTTSSIDDYSEKKSPLLPVLIFLALCFAAYYKLKN